MAGNRHHCATRSGQGFTLAELVVCLSIIAVVSLVAVPRFANALARTRAQSAAQRLAADIDAVRRTARTTATARTLLFDVAADTYHVVGMADPDRPSQTYLIKLREEPYNADLASVSAGGDSMLVFDAFGAPDTAASVLIVVGQWQWTVDVAARTGIVTVTSN